MNRRSSSLAALDAFLSTIGSRDLLSDAQVSINIFFFILKNIWTLRSFSSNTTLLDPILSHKSKFHEWISGLFLLPLICVCSLARLKIASYYYAVVRCWSHFFTCRFSTFCSLLVNIKVCTSGDRKYRVNCSKNYWIKVESSSSIWTHIWETKETPEVTKKKFHQKLNELMNYWN